MQLTINCSFSNNIVWNNTVPQNITPGKHADVWQVYLPAQLGKIQEYYSYLSEEEMNKAGNFYRPDDKDRFVVARGVCRTLLAMYADKHVDDISILKKNTGKPVLESLETGLHFNISHSNNKIVIIIASTEVGADIEDVHSEFEFEDILNRCFSEDEKQYVTDAETPLKKFFLLWTRKEAIVKATSVGITDGLSKIVCLDGINNVDTDDISSTKSWIVNSFYTDEYICSVAMEQNTELRFFDYEQCFNPLTKIKY